MPSDASLEKISEAAMPAGPAHLAPSPSSRDAAAHARDAAPVGPTSALRQPPGR